MLVLRNNKLQSSLSICPIPAEWWVSILIQSETFSVIPHCFTLFHPFHAHFPHNFRSIFHSKLRPIKFRWEHQTNHFRMRFDPWQRSQKDGAFAAGHQPQALRLSAVRYDSVWKLPGEAKLFISTERSVGGCLRVLPAHSAVVWATNCTSRKTLCNHHAIVYSGRVTTATGFRDWAEELVLVGGRKSVVDSPYWP